MEKKVQQIGKIVTDTSPLMQPENTSRFALNVVNESTEGDLFQRSSEEATAPCYELPSSDSFLLGDVTLSNGDRAIFVVDNGNSYILIADKDCNTEIVFTDENQEEKMGFSIEKQIDAIFRLRRGCERTLYWVDPKPRTFSIDRPDKHKNEDGTWNLNSFDLIRRPKLIPEFQSLRVLNTGGQLAPGSYNVQVQFLDEDFNPTEFVVSSDTIKIYNESTIANFQNIRGNSNVESALNVPSNTSKAIRVVLSNLDTNFPFYRLAFTEATAGLGLPSRTVYTDVIPTSVNSFTYTGTNFVQEGTQEEVILPATIIEEARHIDQQDNMLLLSDTKGLKTNFCAFQKYASRITVDCVTKTVFLNQVAGANPKNPIQRLEGLGYMPKEIYALGIVYELEGGIFTPNYHIPGKSEQAPETYTLGALPMSKNNKSASTLYTDNNSCGDDSYWGKDFEGNILLNTPVRHHRFPSRREVGLPLVEEIVNDEASNADLVASVEIKISGVLSLPDCPDDEPNCLDNLNPIFYSITYRDTETLEEYTFGGAIDFNTWSDDGNTPPSDFQSDITPAVVAGGLEVIAFEEIAIDETDPDNPIEVVTDLLSADPSIPVVSPVTGLAYSATVVPGIFNTNVKQYKTQVFGLRFSNIQIPTPDEIGGKKVVGYFFTRAIRNEEDKTIVDSAVMLPTIKNNNFIAQGLLSPELTPQDLNRLDRKNFGFISPEHKFRNSQINDFSRISQEGAFVVTERFYSNFKVQDVVDGTSYRSNRHRREERDRDGWDLHIQVRQNESEYEIGGNMPTLQQSAIEDVFYLNPLGSRRVEGTNDEVFNLASDNKIGILSLKANTNFDIGTALPYVLLERDNANPYSNFRSIPYIRISRFIEKTLEPGHTHTAFNGDTTISSMQYLNTLFLESRVRRRKAKRGNIFIVIGAALVGAALIIFTAGIATPLVALGMAAAIGTALVIAGVEQENYRRVFSRLYDRGLRRTILDSRLSQWFALNPTDDEFRWFTDTIELWFESQVNTSLRFGTNVGTVTDFINSPAPIEVTPNDNIGRDFKPSLQIHEYLVNKFTFLDVDRTIDERGYYGAPLPELYLLNLDYQRENLQKTYQSLSIEFDCCSDCLEEFPHRTYYSEQSFEEELTDNYRVILPNNYRDIEGGTGRINDIFTIGPNIYILTQHALWHQPQNFQERVTSDIVSFIGTGSYFAVPPRKIVDDENNSAGTQHKWGVVKTPYGVMYPSSIENKVYLFNGEKLQPISSEGNQNFFRENMKSLLEQNYYQVNQRNYPYRDNPVNAIGTGYIGTYDTRFDRLIVTKKDKVITNLPEQDYEVCSEGSNFTVFSDFQKTVSDMQDLGYTFAGVENCRLKFEKLTYEEETKLIPVTVPVVTDDTIIVIAYDYSGSFNQFNRLLLARTVQEWYNTIRPEDSFNPLDIQVVTNYNNSLFTGSTKLVFLPRATFTHPVTSEPINSADTAQTERYLLMPYILTEDCPGWPTAHSAIKDFEGKDIVMISFVNEAIAWYTQQQISAYPIVPPKVEVTQTFKDDYAVFTDITGIANPATNKFKSFNAVLYPIIFNVPDDGSLRLSCLAFLRHVLAASDFAWDDTKLVPPLLPLSNALTPIEAASFVADLKFRNPYNLLEMPHGNLKTIGWKYSVRPGRVVTDVNVTPVSVEEIANDLAPLLFGQETSVIVETEVSTLVPTFEVEYIDGVPFEPVFENNSWTFSYSLKEKGWVSFHSYLPSYYMTDTERFYSWSSTMQTLHRHGIKGEYLNFYGISYPMILEYVINDAAAVNKIVDYLMFQTKAEAYDPTTETFVDMPEVTFDKLLVYNSYQISPLLNLVQKSATQNYLTQQVVGQGATDILIDRNERDWSVNNFRNYRANNNIPLFSKSLADRQPNYYIDKVLNPSAIDLNKAWHELESFRDKFLVVRLIYNNFANVKLTMEFSITAPNPSER